MAASETLERQVREEQEEFEEDGQADASASSTSDEEAKPEEALFDKSEYEREELQLPKVDGEPTDKIAIKFSGTVNLDRSDPRDVALMRRMKLGGDLTLQVEAKCAGKGHGFTTNREGDLDAVVLQHAVRVHTVYQPVTEEEAA